MENLGKAQDQNKVQKNEHAAANDEQKKAEFKAKKAEAAKRFAENQKKRKEEFIAFAKRVVANEKVFGLLSDADKNYISNIANPPVKTSAGSSRTSFFGKVFGDEPKVGDSITIMDYMKKTMLSKGQLDRQIKVWAEKGIVVEFQENKDDRFQSKYVIKALPKAE